MGIFRSLSLERKIRKSIDDTLNALKNEKHRVTLNTFYGSYFSFPATLDIWYLFDRISDLNDAEANGYTDQLIVSTIENLTKNGFPEMSSMMNAYDINEVRFSDSLKKQIQSNQIHVIFQSPKNAKITIAFSSKEDVEIEAHGDYHIYFQ